MDDLFAKYGIKAVKATIPTNPRANKRKSSILGPRVSAHCRVDDCDDCSGWRKGGKCVHACHKNCECDWEIIPDARGKCLSCGRDRKEISIKKREQWDDNPLF